MTAVAFTINGKAMSVETEPDTARPLARAALCFMHAFTTIFQCVSESSEATP